MKTLSKISISLIFLINMLVIQAQNSEKLIELPDKYTIVASLFEELDTVKTYYNLKIFQNNNLILMDSTDTEYEFTNKSFPIIRKLKNGNYEILLEINSRPNKNLLRKVIVNNSKVISDELLPTFLTKARNIDDAGFLYYVGYWDDSQEWGKDKCVTAYNPILYFKSTENGIFLDSTKTIKKNEDIFGKFYGFKFDESIEIPCENKKFQMELDFISNK